MYTLRIVGLRALIALGGLWMLAAVCAAQAPMADPLNYAGPPRKQDEVFLLSTRQLGALQSETDPSLSLSLARYSEKETWEPLALETLLKDRRDATTLIYVHGYDFDDAKVERIGWAFYHEFCDGLPADKPVRFIVWSWPTVAKKYRPVRDFIEKARRSDTDAYYLAWVIAQLPPDTRVGLTGSALGCQVVQGALHLLGGGALGRLALAHDEGRVLPEVSTVFIAPAVHNDWLYPGGFHERAMASTSRLLLVNNSIDVALCRYGQPWKSKPVALGQSGVTELEKLGEFASRLEQFDASEQIGESHGVEHYLRQVELVARMRKVLLPR